LAAPFVDSVRRHGILQPIPGAAARQPLPPDCRAQASGRRAGGRRA
jgi:hypothetical protein